MKTCKSLSTLLFISVAILLVAIYTLHQSASHKATEANEDTEHPTDNDVIKRELGRNCNRSYTVSDIGSDLLDIVPRRAFYDNRKESGKPRDVVIILTEILDTRATKESIIACELNGFFSTKINVNVEQTWWVRKNRPGHTHANSRVYCKGLPKNSIQSGSTVRLVYQDKGDGCYSMIAAEKTLVLMKPVESSKKSSVVICTALFDHPPYFDHWLKYQRTIGIDKIHLSVEASFAENATEIYPSLKEALSSGFAIMDVWNNYVGDKIYYYSHTTKLHDCLMRYTGVYEFAFISDVDEFFIPLVPKKKDIHYYVGRFFKDKSIAAAALLWKIFSCPPVQSKMDHLTDGNMTMALSGLKAKWDNNYKTFHRLSAIKTVGPHLALSWLSDFEQCTRVNRDLAYLAHIKPALEC